MPVYDLHGNSLGGVYSAAGMSLSSAYDVSGNKVFDNEQGQPDYSRYSFVQKWASKGIGSTQGFDIYDGMVFWVSKSGNASVPANCYVWNLQDGSQALDSQPITIYSGHGNNLSIAFPLLYATSAYTPHVYVNSVTDGYVFSLLKTLYLDDGSKDCDACVDETDDTILWSLGHDPNDTSSASNPPPYLLSKWDLKQLTDNGDGTFTPRRISTVSAERPICYYFQGCKFHDGLLWFASGYAGASTEAYVYAVNPSTGEIVHTIDCETTAEPEGVAWVQDDQSAGGYAMYVGFQGMMMRKYVFQTL